MNVVITMAGLGSRFRKAGYKEPKYMITAKGRSLFYWSMISLESFRSNENKYIFIVRKEDQAKQFIQIECAFLNLVNFEVIEIDYLTDGQATTAMLAKAYWDSEKPLLIYNIDTHINPSASALSKENINEDGWIPCFNAPGEKWSFVKCNEKGFALELREKKRISDNATIGLYWFATANLYEKSYQKYYSVSGNEELGEKYIAPLYNQLINDGYKVTISIIPNNEVQVLGTPEELEEFNRNQYKLSE